MSSFFSKLFCPSTWWGRGSTRRNTSQEPTGRDLESQHSEKAPAGFWSRLFSCCFSPRSKGDYKPKNDHHQRTQNPLPHPTVPNSWQPTTAANDGITNSATTTSTTKHHDDHGKVVVTLEPVRPTFADDETGSLTTITKADGAKKTATYGYPVFSAAESSAGGSFEMLTTGDDESAPEQVIIHPPPKIHLVSSSIIDNGGVEDPYSEAAVSITGNAINAEGGDDHPFRCSSARQASVKSHHSSLSQVHSPGTTTPSGVESTQLAAASGRAIFKDWIEYISEVREEWEQRRATQQGNQPVSDRGAKSPSSEVESQELAAASGRSIFKDWIEYIKVESQELAAAADSRNAVQKEWAEYFAHIREE